MSHLKKPVQKGREVFIAPTATVIGDVILGDNSSVWYGAVIRGDTETITIGSRTNIQDNAVVHADPGVPATIGNNVIVGHQAIVHGATVGDHTLIGMQATILNNAVIGKFCIIGAKALVTEGMVVPDHSVVMGIPGVIVKQTGPAVVEKIKKNAETYVNLAKEHMEFHK